MVTPDPISEWSQDEISSWINGLDIGLDRYKESLKYLTGDQLLTAKYTDLYQYGIDKGSVQTYFPDFFYQLRIVRGPYRCSGDSLLLNRKKVGHQEVILDAILLLDDTVREIRFGSLKSTAKKLFEKCLKLQNLRNPMQNDRPIGGHGFPLDTINSSQLSNKVCLIKIQMDQLTWISHSRLIHF